MTFLQGAGIEDLKWFSLDQLQEMRLKGQLGSPEILEYITETLQPLNFYALTYDPAANKECFDLLNEVTESRVLVKIPKSNVLSPQQNLLKEANFSEKGDKYNY